jgi:RNA recognition motif-containing protein
MNIYVGNLSLEVSEDDLIELFSRYGQVKRAEIKREMFSGTSKGFGFVDMPGHRHSLTAIAGLNGKDLMGQSLRVNEARERPQRRRR